MNECIVIMGRGRSGTSCVAGILHNSGVVMGNDLKKSNPNNKLGFFEDLDFLNFHMNLIKRKWKDPKIFMSPNNIKQYRQIILKKQKQKLWGVKDPLLCFMFPVFQSLCDCDIKIINVHRPIDQSAKSLILRNNRWEKTDFEFMSMEEAIKICHKYDEAKDESLKDVPKKTIYNIYYDQLIENSNQQIKNICKFLKIDPTKKSFQFVCPQLKHKNILRLFL